MADEVLYSINAYNGNGTQKVFEVSFAGGYISKAHVKAYITDANKTQTPVSFSWTNDNTVIFDVAPAIGEKLVIYRDTPKILPLADFTDGAVITEASLDLNAKQAVFIAAEAIDRAVFGVLAPVQMGGLVLPSVESRANKLLGFGSAGAFALYDLSTTDPTMPPPNTGVDMTKPLFLTDYWQDGDGAYREPGGRSNAGFSAPDNPAWKRAVADATLLKRPIYIEPGKGNGPRGEWSIGTYGQNGYGILSADGTAIDRIVPLPNNTGNLASGLVVVGASDGSTIIHKPEGVPYIFFCNPAGQGTAANPHTVNAGDGFNNIIFRNLHLKDDVVGRGFSEQQALIHVNAVKGLLISGCWFTGYRGDGVYIGAGDIGGGPQNRHNALVQLRDCRWDGINTNNRNGISVIDCDGLYTENCSVKNSGKRGNISNKPTLDPYDPDTSYGAPAAFMDIEPNNFTAPNGVVRNILCVNTTVENSGTSAVAFFFLSNNGQVVPFTNFVYRNTTVRGCYRGAIQTFGDPSTSTPYGVLFDGGECTGGTRAGEMLAAQGVTITNYTFRDIPSPLDIGYVGGQLVNGLSLRSVKFIRVGQGTGAGAVRVRGGSNWNWADVEFVDCSACGITWLGPQRFQNSKFANLRFRMTTPNSMPVALRVATFEGAVDFDNGTVEFVNCDFGNLVLDGVMAVGVPASVAPSAGRWARGNIVPARPFEAGGPDPRGWLCINGTVYNTDGTVKTLADFRQLGVVPGAAADVTPTSISPGFSLSQEILVNGAFRYSVVPNTNKSTGGVSNSTFTTVPNIRLQFRCGHSGLSGTYIGILKGATPLPATGQTGARAPIISDFIFAVWQYAGRLVGVVNSQPYGDMGPYEYGDTVDFRYNDNQTVTVYNGRENKFYGPFQIGFQSMKTGFLFLNDQQTFQLTADR